VRSKWRSERIEQRVADVLSSIDAIDEFLAGYDFDAYVRDRKTQSAVERQLLIISEGMTRLTELEQDLPEERRFESRFPHVDVYQIRGMGNRVRHEYRYVNASIIWDTAKGRDLKDLRAALLEGYPSTSSG